MTKVARVQICLRPKMRGLSTATKDLIVRCRALLEDDYPQTLRHLHYQLLNAHGLDYQNDVRCYRRLSRALTIARRSYRASELAGLDVSPEFSIPSFWIVDEERKPERVSVWKDAIEFVGTVREAYRRDNWQDQPNYCELWGEKKAVLGSLRPISQKWGITLRACKGFGSTGMEDQIGRLFEHVKKPITVFYVGDHDASGTAIDTDMHRRVEIASGVPFRMIRLAIHQEDIKRFNLPPQRIKDADTRAAAFRKRFGQNAGTVELEALPSAELKRRVDRAIRKLIDTDLWDRQSRIQEVELQCIVDFADRMKHLPQIGGA